ncbi:hypothetical protein FRC98_11285 [Lujinxingia vulgaris]|uniref:Uncharacterized protein n=1 Tax=Lujinxingia vulgaris TaxID=2600176 RepID=A0A5C6XA90_9DELT|nr:hypothetical protein [Lujinxingia vulgaris]TXD37306.1 hypothetical protein FRC98_11285 [Lujinxingia vulgaris]
MNTNQVKSLSALASQFVQRAHAYMEQADACGFDTEDLQAHAERFTASLQNNADVDEAMYRELALKMLAHVDHILEVLDQTERPDAQLIEIAMAVKNTSRLLSAVHNFDARFQR